MLVSLSTACLFPWPLSTVFALAKEAGFDGVELVVDAVVSGRGSDYVSRLIETFQLPVLSVHPPIFPLPGWVEQKTRCLKTVELGNTLGCRWVVLHAPWPRSGRGATYRAALEAIQWAQRACSSGLNIALENGRWYCTAPLGGTGIQDALAYLRHMENLAQEQGWWLTLDTTHAGSAGVDIMQAYELFKDRLVNIHLSDLCLKRWPGFLRQLPLIYDNLVQHTLPGRGVLPLKTLLGRLRADHYRGLVTVEASPLAFQVWSQSKVRGILRQVLQLCRE